LGEGAGGGQIWGCFRSATLEPSLVGQRSSVKTGSMTDKSRPAFDGLAAPLSPASAVVASVASRWRNVHHDVTSASVGNDVGGHVGGGHVTRIHGVGARVQRKPVIRLFFADHVTRAPAE